MTHLDPYKLYSNDPAAALSFRLAGANLDPAAITAALGTPPDKAWQAGDAAPDGSTRAEGVWAIYPDCASDELFPTLLASLLRRIDSLPPALDALIAQHRAEVVIASPPDDVQSVDDLNAFLVRRIEGKGIQIVFDRASRA